MKKRLAFAQLCVTTGWKGALALCVALCALGLALPQDQDNDDNATFVTFNAPGAGLVTSPSSINQAGEITGDYTDTGGRFHGFLRSPWGAFTTFDPPGSVETFANSINPAGAITGTYNDASLVSHVFLRAPDGAFTTFDPPGSVLGVSQSAINPA